MNLKQLLIGGAVVLGMGLGVSQVGFTHGEACKGDIDKYCKDAQGWDAKKQCMTQNKAKFTPECQAMIEKHKSFVRPAKGRKEILWERKEGKGKGKSCLRDHLNELSSECRSLLNDHS
jgi:hypothetical protein